jgi:methyl-accepting chemotaxis protein
MNFEEAIAAHVNWKTKLRVLIGGQGDVDANSLATDTACALGQWLYGEGAKYASQPAYATLKSAHQKFHKVAGAIATKAKSGQKAAASTLLDGAEYGQASMAVVQSLTALRKTVEGK